MGTFFTYAKRAFKFSDKQMEALDFLLEYFRKDLPFTEIDNFADVDFKFSPAMNSIDDKVLGMWHYFSPNTVYICMDNENQSNPKLEGLAYRYLDFDNEVFGFVLHMLNNDGQMLATIFHELWHRHQFMENPLKYLASSIGFAFLPYDYSCTHKWSIEYDVRQKVDNQILRCKIKEFANSLKNYLYCSNILASSNANDDIKQYAYDTLQKIDEVTIDFAKTFKKD